MRTRTEHRHTAALIAAATTITLVGAYLMQTEPPSLVDSLSGPDRLVTNEFAYRYPESPDAVASDHWFVTSGSLFVRDGVGYSGAPTRGPVDPRSQTQTNSGVFRAVTRSVFAEDIRLSLRLRMLTVNSSDLSGVSDWDGLHIFMRYLNESHLYVASVARRDGVVTFKRKTPGGSSNGGTYHTLQSRRRLWIGNDWHTVTVHTLNTQDGVRLAASVDGEMVLDTVDRSSDAPTIGVPGRVGIRADNTEFEVADVQVEACDAITLARCE